MPASRGSFSFSFSFSSLLTAPKARPHRPPPWPTSQKERGRPPTRRGRVGGFHWCPGYRGCRVTALVAAPERGSTGQPARWRAWPCWVVIAMREMLLVRRRFAGMCLDRRQRSGQAGQRRRGDTAMRIGFAGPVHRAPSSPCLMKSGGKRRAKAAKPAFCAV